MKGLFTLCYPSSHAMAGQERTCRSASNCQTSFTDLGVISLWEPLPSLHVVKVSVVVHLQTSILRKKIPHNPEVVRFHTDIFGGGKDNPEACNGGGCGGRHVVLIYQSCCRAAFVGSMREVSSRPTRCRCIRTQSTFCSPVGSPLNLYQSVAEE